jgi:beta-hydroxylase
MDKNIQKRLRRISIFAVIVLAGLYFVPYLMAFYLICGVLDITREHKITYELVEKYFMGNGILTWMLSPLNLLTDLFSLKNPGVYKLQDLPDGHRAEIEACVAAFRDNGDLIKQRVAETLGTSKRGMLTFRWFNKVQPTVVRIPELEREHRYIKTVAISVFNTRERTSWHFGPLRLTLRVLYNLDPIDSREVYIQADDKTHYWIDDPLFIFDDTFFHCSINGVDKVRYCLFMDITRPNRAQVLFDRAVDVAAFVSGSLKTLFYKNWSFIR